MPGALDKEEGLSRHSRRGPTPHQRGRPLRSSDVVLEWIRGIVLADDRLSALWDPKRAAFAGVCPVRHVAFARSAEGDAGRNVSVPSATAGAGLSASRRARPGNGGTATDGGSGRFAANSGPRRRCSALDVDWCRSGSRNGRAVAGSPPLAHDDGALAGRRSASRERSSRPRAFAAGRRARSRRAPQRAPGRASDVAHDTRRCSAWDRTARTRDEKGPPAARRPVVSSACLRWNGTA
jgi:hypothetical protein